jgi:hypothetical protein
VLAMYLPAILWLWLLPIAAVVGILWLRYDSIGGVTRMKMAFILASLIFTASCVGLWMMMRVLTMLLVTHYPKGAVLGGFQIFCFSHSGWLPFLAIPALGYASRVSLRGVANVERFCLFASVLTLVFVVLFFAVIVAGMMCGIPLFDANPK